MNKLNLEDIVNIYNGTYHYEIDGNKELFYKVDLFDYYVDLLNKSKILYENELLYKRYNIMTLSGDHINIHFNKGPMAHLLGVKCNYLKTKSLFSGCNSYECLSIICEYSSMVKSEILAGNLDIELMFSKFIEQKNLIFQQLPTFDNELIKNIRFISEYDKTVSNNVRVKALNSNCFVGIQKNSNSDLTILGLIKDRYNKYVVNSNIGVYNNDDYCDNLDAIIGDQNLLCPVSSQFIVYRNSICDKTNYFDLSDEDINEKMDILNSYEDICRTKVKKLNLK